MSSMFNVSILFKRRRTVLLLNIALLILVCVEASPFQGKHSASEGDLMTSETRSQGYKWDNQRWQQDYESHQAYKEEGPSYPHRGMPTSSKRTPPRYQRTPQETTTLDPLSRFQYNGHPRTTRTQKVTTTPSTKGEESTDEDEEEGSKSEESLPVVRTEYVRPEWRGMSPHYPHPHRYPYPTGGGGYTNEWRPRRRLIRPRRPPVIPLNRHKDEEQSMLKFKYTTSPHPGSKIPVTTQATESSSDEVPEESRERNYIGMPGYWKPIRVPPYGYNYPRWYHVQRTKTPPQSEGGRHSSKSTTPQQESSGGDSGNEDGESSSKEEESAETTTQAYYPYKGTSPGKGGFVGYPQEAVDFQTWIRNQQELTAYKQSHNHHQRMTTPLPPTADDNAKRQTTTPKQRIRDDPESPNQDTQITPNITPPPTPTTYAYPSTPGHQTYFSNHDSESVKNSIGTPSPIPNEVSHTTGVTLSATPSPPPRHNVPPPPKNPHIPPQVPSNALSTAETAKSNSVVVETSTTIDSQTTPIPPAMIASTSYTPKLIIPTYMKTAGSDNIHTTAGHSVRWPSSLPIREPSLGTFIGPTRTVPKDSHSSHRHHNHGPYHGEDNGEGMASELDVTYRTHSKDVSKDPKDNVSQDDQERLKAGEVAGVVIGVVSLIATLVGCITFLVLKKPLSTDSDPDYAPDQIIASEVQTVMRTGYTPSDDNAPTPERPTRDRSDNHTLGPHDIPRAVTFMGKPLAAISESNSTFNSPQSSLRLTMEEIQAGCQQKQSPAPPRKHDRPRGGGSSVIF